MAIKEVKAGEKYTLELLGVGMTQDKFTDGEWGALELPSGRLVSIRPCDFEALSPENGIKNTETAPKYDPSRKFRTGDLVRLKAYNGRKPYDFWHKQTIEHFGAKLDTVLADELDSGNVDIFQDAPIDELTVRVHASHLELVTPVEEMEPYSVSENLHGWVVFKDTPGNVIANFNNTHPHAKAAAEAERDRLNAEYRKEVE